MFLLFCALLMSFLSAISTTGCSETGRLNQKVEELNKELDDCNKTIAKLESEKAETLSKKKDLTKRVQAQAEKIEGLKKELKSKKNGFDITLEKLEVVSDHVHKEGPAAKRFYGLFDVKVVIKNNSGKKIENVRIIARQESTNIAYSRPPRVIATKTESIGSVAPGESKVIKFSGFNVDHPDMIQEVIVNIPMNGQISKVSIEAAFPPGGGC